MRWIIYIFDIKTRQISKIHKSDTNLRKHKGEYLINSGIFCAI